MDGHEFIQTECVKSADFASAKALGFRLQQFTVVFLILFRKLEMPNLGNRSELSMLNGNSIASDNGGRRSGADRRQFSYSYHMPERRSGADRRSGSDRRKCCDKQLSDERRVTFRN